MKKLTLSFAIVSAFVMHSAFARDLGVLDNSKVPQNLIPATEFSQYLKSVDNAQEPNQSQNRNSAHSRWWYGGYGGYYGSYYPYYYPYYSYPYYGYGYGYGSWWADEQGNRPAHRDANTQNHAVDNMDAAHVPVVCFASDQNGHWFAHADLALNVESTQQVANRECVSSGGNNCSLNLGCALATPERASTDVQARN